MKSALGRWWRRERRALTLLPVALVVVLICTGSRLDAYWWSNGFHQKASVEGGWAQIDDTFDDGYLRYPIRAQVRMESVRAVVDVPGSSFGTKIATGGQLWEVRLRWRAAPEIALRGCHLAIFDREGVQYDAGSSGWDAGSWGYKDKCVPDETPGPRPEVGSRAQPRVPDDEEPRPESWSSTAYVLTKAGITPSTVRIWYFLPRYAELEVSAVG